MLKGFKEFAIKGNFVDIAVGMILGAGVVPIAKSLVDDIVMPPVGMLMGNVDFQNIFLVIKDGATPPPYLNLAAAKASGAVTMNFGIFINTIITFFIVAFVAYMLMQVVQKFRDEFKRTEPSLPPEPTEKECGYCFSKISLKASRCPHCTSALN